MGVVVDRSRCNGLGVCEAFAPDVFEVDGAGEVVLLTEKLTDDQADRVDQAIAACPTEALSRV
ncbi:ferredoxin [Micromonospora sp. HUAS LYJ1]|uniref:ferredoxin n=1 Tax=Micromonospora sp. HUAS LYJ1 TaxID=3061626 RepID=UPI002673CFE4|nr:ferredoxin [Micromonospora sp. HUAS LYJ1]WKU03549.1 ferredoxin [Micromonospora sp. HUAS LYJ1]